MSTKVRLLVYGVPSTLADALVHELRRARLDVRESRVEGRVAFTRELADGANVVLLASGATGMSPQEALGLARATRPGIGIVVTGGPDDPEEERRWLAEGADAVVPADLPATVVPAVVRILSADAMTAALDRREMERLRSIIASIPVMIAFEDLAQGFVYVNDEWTRVLGWTVDAMAGRDMFAELFPDPEERARARAFMDAAPHEWRRFRLLARNGSSIETRWTNLRLPDGTTLAIGLDVTRETELESEVLRSQRLAEIGTLLASAAHEVRNPLFGISSTLDAFTARIGDQPAFQRHLETLRGEVGRLARLMQDLLDFGRGEVHERTTTRLSLILDAAVTGCRGQAAARQVAVVVVDQSTRAVDVDVERVRQILENLICNAVQHSAMGGEVKVRLADAVEGGRPGVCTSVEDEGAGFAPEDIAHVFEPFYSRRRGGTGMGLAIAHRFALQHEGTLAVKNRPAGGAQVDLFLPAAGAAATTRGR